MKRRDLFSSFPFTGYSLYVLAGSADAAQPPVGLARIFEVRCYA